VATIGLSGVAYDQSGLSREGRRPNEDTERSGVPQWPLTSWTCTWDQDENGRPDAAGLPALVTVAKTLSSRVV